MAKQELPVDFKDDVLQPGMAGKRKYRVIQNEDGTISLEDVTEYSQIGSNFGAAQMNATNNAVNESFDKRKVIDSLSDIAANEQGGYAAGALAVRELNDNMKDLMFVKAYTLDNQTLKAGTTEFFTVPAGIISGYSRGAYVISIKNATSSGANSSFCFCYQADLASNGVTVALRNTGSSNAKIKIQVDMEYFAEHIIKK